MANDGAERLIELAAQCADDPYSWALGAYDWGKGALQGASGPREWQADTLKGIRDHLQNPETRFMPYREAIASGHGIGKSACISMVINWALSTMVDTRVVYTANTKDQLLTKTSPEVLKWMRAGLTVDWFALNAMSVYSVDQNHRETWRADATTWSENNTEAFAGLHNQGRRIVLIFDEASNIAPKVWEVAQGALTDENTEIIWLAFGNPTRNTGTFYECFGKLRHLWRTRQIDSRTVEGVNTRYLDELVETYGEDHDFVRVRVRGVFPRAGVQQFISSELVREAVDRETAQDVGAAVIVGVDVARFGDDQSVIIVRRGRDILETQTFRKVDTMTLTSRVAKMMEAWNYDAVMIDGVGVGAGVIDRLRQMGYSRGVIEVNAGSAAEDKDKYMNKRGEMWDRMREWLRTASLPDNQELMDDLTGLEYTYTNDKLVLEKKEDMKKRGLSSPDLADALAHTFAERVARRDVVGVGEFYGRGLGHRQMVADADYDEYA